MNTDPSRPALTGGGSLPPRATDAAAGAKLLVLLLAFAWGFNWIATAFALPEVPPWSLRFVGTGLGAITLVAATWLSGRSMRVAPGAFKHIFVAGLLNVTIFNLCSAFAQLYGATSRAVIVTYSMPIWACVMAWLILGDRLDRVRLIALGLCVAGIGILVWPLFSAGLPLGVFFSLGCALSWAIATVYTKWAKIEAEPLVNAAWQLIFGTAVLLVGMLIVEGHPHVWPISTQAVLAILFIGLFGVGLAHFLWWAIVDKLPTTTASLGSLLVPIVGVGGSALLLGERLTTTDIVGFASIFAAAACVLLQRTAKHDEMPE